MCQKPDRKGGLEPNALIVRKTFEELLYLRRS